MKTLLEMCKEQLVGNELPNGWIIGPCSSEAISILYVVEQEEEGFDHFAVLKGLKVFADGKQEVYALGQVITKESTPVLEGLPPLTSPKNLIQNIQFLTDLEICQGNGDKEFLELRQARKDLFVDKKGEKSNFVDKRFFFPYHITWYHQTQEMR